MSEPDEQHDGGKVRRRSRPRQAARQSIRELVALTPLCLAGGFFCLLIGCDGAASNGFSLCGIEDIAMVSISHKGHYAGTTSGVSWEMTLRRSGTSTAALLAGEAQERDMPFSTDQFRSVLQTLRRHDFCEWPRNIGKPVPDGATRTITVKNTSGEHKTVDIHFLDHEDDHDLLANVVSAWSSLRGHLALDRAVDARPHDEKALKRIRK